MHLVTGMLAGVLAVLLGLSGCATSGTPTGGGPATGQFLILNDQLVAQIKDGVSTKEDVKALFGDLKTIGGQKEYPGLPAGMEMWCYQAATQTHGHALCIAFKDGIVQSHDRQAIPRK